MNRPNRKSKTDKFVASERCNTNGGSSSISSYPARYQISPPHKKNRLEKRMTVPCNTKHHKQVSRPVLTLARQVVTTVDNDKANPE